MNWELSDMIHYGRLKITGTILSKSKIRAGIEQGIFTGWDDIRLGTLRALAKRGILPETIRQLIVNFGIKGADATVSWDNLYSYNRKLLDKKADRYFFVSNPITLTVDKIDKPYISNQPFHPDYPERGFRTFKINPSEGAAKFLVSKDDLPIFNTNNLVRLMGLFNIEIKEVVGDDVRAIFHSEPYEIAKKNGAPLIHWLPIGEGIKTNVIMPDNTIKSGLSEISCSKLRRGDIPQFERFGFVRIDKVNDTITAYYAHK
jgi:glutamyl-tRNA synthetase